MAAGEHWVWSLRHTRHGDLQQCRPLDELRPHMWLFMTEANWTSRSLDPRMGGWIGWPDTSMISRLIRLILQCRNPWIYSLEIRYDFYCSMKKWYCSVFFGFDRKWNIDKKWTPTEKKTWIVWRKRTQQHPSHKLFATAPCDLLNLVPIHFECQSSADIQFAIPRITQPLASKGWYIPSSSRHKAPRVR